MINPNSCGYDRLDVWAHVCIIIPVNGLYSVHLNTHQPDLHRHRLPQVVLVVTWYISNAYKGVLEFMFKYFMVLMTLRLYHTVAGGVPSPEDTWNFCFLKLPAFDQIALCLFTRMVFLWRLHCHFPWCACHSKILRGCQGRNRRLGVPVSTLRMAWKPRWVNGPVAVAS